MPAISLAVLVSAVYGHSGRTCLSGYGVSFVIAYLGRTSLNHSSECLSDGLQSAFGADGTAYHSRTGTLFNDTVLLEVLNEVGPHHLATVGYGVVECQDVHRRDSQGVAISQTGQGGA